MRGFRSIDVLAEPIQSLAPEMLILTDPIGDLAKRSRIEVIEPLPANAPFAYQSDLPQHLELLRDGRLRKIELLRELGSRGLARPEQGQERTPDRACHSSKNVRSGLPGVHRAQYISDD